jgi:hypothetical protein
VSALKRLVQLHEILTPADHQTHRRYPFQVPSGSRQLDISVRYAPKRLGEQESLVLAQAALARQRSALAARVGEPLAEQWAANYRPTARRARIANLLTISLDDADGVYRGAGHRHAPDQHFVLAAQDASPGLVAGPLRPGQWILTLSAHTLVSDQCELSIQIDAEIASRR